MRSSSEQLIDPALKEIGGLLDYLQSPEARRNADRIRLKRQKRRELRNQEQPNQEPPNRKPGTGNHQP